MPKTHRSKKIDAFLFDLGKVLLHFDFTPAFRRLSKNSGWTEKQIDAYFRKSGLEVLYDGGKITSLQFYRTVKGDLNHRLDFIEFKNVWNDIFTPNKEMLALVHRLKKQHRLVMISNTNAMHYEYIRVRWRDLVGAFDRVLLSYKEKMRKPDHRLYRKAARACFADPSNILYIDDREDLTQAAKEMGFHTFTYKNNHGALIQHIHRLGVQI